MGGIGLHLAVIQPVGRPPGVPLGGVIAQHVADTGHAGQRGRLKHEAFAVICQREQFEQMLIAHGMDAAEQGGHHAPDEGRGATHRQAIGAGAIVQPDILHRDAVMFAGQHAQQHAGGADRFSEEAVHGVTEDLLEAVGHATRSAADATGQIDAERVAGIHRDALRRELLREAAGRRGVAHEQIPRAFIIDEVGVGLLRFLAPRGDGLAVIPAVLHDLRAPGAQQVLLPLLGIRRHVHGDAKAEPRAHDADAEPQIAGGAHHDLLAGQQVSYLITLEGAVVVFLMQQPCVNGETLGMLEHFMDAAARLDRTRDGQGVVTLDHQAAGQRGFGCAERRCGRGYAAQRLLQAGRCHQR